MRGMKLDAVLRITVAYGDDDDHADAVQSLLCTNLIFSSHVKREIDSKAKKRGT